MFASKARAYPSEADFRYPTLTLPTNIRLGWKDVSGTNTLAYFEH